LKKYKFKTPSLVTIKNCEGMKITFAST